MLIGNILSHLASVPTPAQDFACGAELYHQGETCDYSFVVMEGWVALTVILDDGSCQILDFALPGAFLALPLAFAPMYHTARCLTDTRVCVYSHATLDRFMEKTPRLALDLCRLAASDEARAHDHIVNLSLRGARERVAHLLLELYVRLRGHLPERPGEITFLPLTQADIGQATGLTNVHVSRMLHGLREDGILHFATHALEVLDPEALITAAGLDHEGTAAWDSHASGDGENESIPVGWRGIPPPRDFY